MSVDMEQVKAAIIEQLSYDEMFSHLDEGEVDKDYLAMIRGNDDTKLWDIFAEEVHRHIYLNDPENKKSWANVDGQDLNVSVKSFSDHLVQQIFRTGDVSITVKEDPNEDEKVLNDLLLTTAAVFGALWLRRMGFHSVLAECKAEVKAMMSEEAPEVTDGKPYTE